MRFVKAFSITIISQVVIILSGLVNSVIIVRMLGPQGQGVYSLIITTSVMLLIFSGAGLVASNIYWAKKSREEVSAIFANSLFFAVAISVLVFLAYISFGKMLLLYFFTPDIALILVIALPLLLIQEFNHGILWGLEKYGYYNFLNLLKAGSLVGANIILVLVLRLGIKAAVLGWLLAISLTSVASTFILWREIGITYILPKLSILIRSLKMGIKVLASDIIWFLSTRIDIYLVAFFLGVEDVGFYSIAILALQLSAIIPTILSQFIFNSAIVNNREQGLFSASLIKVTLAYSLIFAFVIITLGKMAIQTFYGQTFIKSFEAIIFLLPATILQSLNITIGRFINGARSMPGQMVYITVLTLISNIGFNLVLIPKLGINGAAISCSLSQLFQLSMLLLILKRFSLKLSISHVLNFRFNEMIALLRRIYNTK